MNNTASLFAIMPILVVMVTGMVVLLGDSCIGLWRQSKFLSPSMSILGLLIAGGYAVQLLSAGGDRTAFNGAIKADAFSQSCSLILIVTAILAVLLATTYLENKKLNLGEYYALVLFSTSGAMLMAAANDLIVLFISIEVLSVALYVLAGFARTEQRSEEAALKYFLLGAFAAGFLLYGIALIYGGSAGAVTGGAPAGGTTNLTQLSAYLKVMQPSLMLVIGLALLAVGLAFKAALVPFHMWTPDVYEGAPTSVTAYMAAAAKIGAFAAILRVFTAFVPIAGYWLIIIQILAVATMVLGNILAVTQDNVKRMLAYSSIAHAGYLTVGIAASVGPAAAHDAAVRGILFYLLAYSLMTMGAFGVLIWLSRRGRDIQTLKDLKGLSRTHPAAAYTMLVFMLSLGGIPPTMGFTGKAFIFYATVLSGQSWLAIILGLISAVSIYYYLRVVWMMCFSEPDDATMPRTAVAPGGVFLTVAASVAASLLFGIAPGLLGPLMDAAQTLLRP
ncbi:MAG TPA: NADH-quinone oxidoreductase subunit N [Chthonomonadaceae bacterium]|nr:NADH-quinone oxidoreductase subunit N [Chthonomonadaceae bacterium]